MLDLWFEKAIRPELRGKAYYVRFADDFLILFRYENEARDVLKVLKRRLGKFTLEVAEDKTRILPTGRFKGTKDEFDFLARIDCSADATFRGHLFFLAVPSLPLGRNGVQLFDPEIILPELKEPLRHPQNKGLTTPNLTAAEI